VLTTPHRKNVCYETFTKASDPNWSCGVT